MRCKEATIAANRIRTAKSFEECLIPLLSIEEFESSRNLTGLQVESSALVVENRIAEVLGLIKLAAVSAFSSTDSVRVLGWFVVAARDLRISWCRVSVAVGVG